jgi:hypothetical protein
MRSSFFELHGIFKIADFAAGRLCGGETIRGQIDGRAGGDFDPCAFVLAGERFKESAVQVVGHLAA